MASYVVNWQRADGQPGWHPVGDVQEATTYVEHLRNHEGVEATRIYRLDEVAFEFKPYFKVELAAASQTSFATRIVPEPEPEAEPEGLAEVVAAPSWTPVEVEPDRADEPESLLENGTARRGLFGR